MLIKFIQDVGSKYLTLLWNTLYVYISTSVVLLPPPMTLPVALYGKTCRLIGHCPLIDRHCNPIDIFQCYQEDLSLDVKLFSHFFPFFCCWKQFLHVIQIFSAKDTKFHAIKIVFNAQWKLNCAQKWFANGRKCLRICVAISRKQISTGIPRNKS